MYLMQIFSLQLFQVFFNERSVRSVKYGKRGNYVGMFKFPSYVGILWQRNIILGN